MLVLRRLLLLLLLPARRWSSSSISIFLSSATFLYFLYLSRFRRSGEEKVRKKGERAPEEGFFE
jgi:hypothetical protein